jgi:hypothetical protein
MFDNLKTNETVEEEKDVLGGAIFIVDSGIYDTVIDMAYMDVSQHGAHSFNIVCKGHNGELIRQTLWVTNRKGENFYPEKDRKTGKPTGKNQYLPGFNVANAICLLSIGEELADVAEASEEKTIKLYDFDEGKETPQQKQVLTKLLGQEITLGMFRQVVDKTKDDGNGNWVPTGETREENEIGKVFRTSDGLTTVEVRAGTDKPEFKDAWADKNTGVTRQLAKGVKGNTGKAGAPGATKSLFSK